ncbi:hypothetical protein AGABI2DRAFT_150805 [Agaricus bisporus var. bisporus H97]|uniref:hypothetical protein n=1 Tax=Agaricus bisporus var. bisporus (strain H97 / ATCC MYA-4626 / FGSC 10389) TaxID=936046 RepID=UPI00029F7B9A|nr:hypothetical protein AGABI2DRAFT_150805 [Agaricus bisporus var. bisporus H97]EKV47327.1 hypothetical protein AGABI2DRAFT_150805 [Agaricus bisporus var. bisporus H97]
MSGDGGEFAIHVLNQNKVTATAKVMKIVPLLCWVTFTGSMETFGLKEFREGVGVALLCG